MFMCRNVPAAPSLKACIVYLVALLTAACASPGAAQTDRDTPGIIENAAGVSMSGEKTFVRPFSNPLTDTSVPDPSIWKENDTAYYVYATRPTIKKSRDMIHWEDVGPMFETKPSFVTTPGAGVWAPDIEKIGDQYVLYYSMSAWGGETTAGIGTAYAETPAGPFKLDKSVDGKGKLFTSDAIGVRNSIDPCFFEEDGQKWLFWGSFRGIYGVKLSEDGMRLADGSEAAASANKVKIAGSAFEGVYIHKRGKYYYLFASIGSCCAALQSTYTTVVGRATSLTGPYLTKNGDSLLKNKYEVLIKGNERFVGPGHNSEIITDKAGTDWIYYHSYDRQAPRQGRFLMIDKLKWVNDWPEVEDAVPSKKDEAPIYK